MLFIDKTTINGRKIKKADLNFLFDLTLIEQK